MVPRWRIFGDFFASCIFSEPRVDIQSATAEIRRGKEDRRKKEEKEEETIGRKYNVCICYAGRP